MPELDREHKAENLHVFRQESDRFFGATFSEKASLHVPDLSTTNVHLRALPGF